MRTLLGVCVIAWALSVSAFAQQTTGNITGRVIDQQGAAIPGATVFYPSDGVSAERLTEEMAKAHLPNAKGVDAEISLHLA